MSKNCRDECFPCQNPNKKGQTLPTLVIRLYFFFTTFSYNDVSKVFFLLVGYSLPVYLWLYCIKQAHLAFIYTLAKTLNDLYPVGKPSLENSANDQHFFFVTQQILYPLPPPPTPPLPSTRGKFSLKNRKLEGGLVHY
jgi:hypothetical protein